MKTLPSKQQLVFAAVALSFAAGAAQAQLLPADQREVWMENSRTQIWKNAYGECWHSFYGPPPPPNECNPAPVAQYVPPPPVVIPAPAPVQYIAPAPAPAPVITPAPAPLPPRKTRG